MEPSFMKNRDEAMYVCHPVFRFVEMGFSLEISGYSKQCSGTAADCRIAK
jgi:hypothetical protein